MAKGKASMETMVIEAGGVRFRVRYEGPKGTTPLLFSNSLGCTLEMWDAQAAFFAKTRRVIRYDVRGHGESSTPAGTWSIGDLGADVLRIMDALHLHKIDIAGCSMGGMVGQWLCTNYGHRIGKAVLGNTAAFMGPPTTDWNARIRMAHHQGMAPIAEAMKLRWFTKRFNETHPVEVTRVTNQVLQATPAGYAGCCAAIRDMDQREAIKSITNPVLVVIGQHDPATTPAAGELIAAAIPGARTLRLEAAHFSNCELPEAYNKGVAAFLDV
jgi:3-oxoadipate enol-lactonase